MTFIIIIVFVIIIIFIFFKVFFTITFVIIIMWIVRLFICVVATLAGNDVIESFFCNLQNH